MKKNNYYSLKNILSKNADYNIIIGERSNGKTYATLYNIVYDYIKNGRQGAYIRRWQDDLIGGRGASVFNSLCENNVISDLTNNEWSTVIYTKNQYHFAKIDFETNKMIADKNVFCYSFSLSASEHDKSSSYPYIYNIVFDEFITRKYYLVDEFIIFMNLLSTIIRDRNDIKIFMLANTVNKFSPYFEEMGLTNITTMEQGTIDLYSYGDSNLTVAVEYCGNITKKKSNKYFAFNNSKLNMITNGKWEISLYPRLPIGTKIYSNDIIFSFYVLFNKQITQGDVIQKDNNLFIFFHKKTTDIKDNNNSLIYSLEDNIKVNYRKNLLIGQTKIDSLISKLFNMNKVFYQSNDIGELIRNYIIQSNKGR